MKQTLETVDKTKKLNVFFLSLKKVNVDHNSYGRFLATGRTVAVESRKDF